MSDNLTKIQVDVLQYAKQCAKYNSDSCKQSLEKKVLDWGYSMDDLNRLRLYFEYEGPLIINVPTSIMENELLRDTHYRNLFETGTSMGNTSIDSRNEWEKQLFGSLYNNSTAFERPKYGSLSLWMGNGYTNQKYYGDSVIQLKRQNVKDRITFTLGDSSHSEDSKSIATLYDFDHVLNKMVNLKTILESLKSTKRTGICGGHTLIPAVEFVEIQVHGEILLVRF